MTIPSTRAAMTVIMIIIGKQKYKKRKFNKF